MKTSLSTVRETSVKNLPASESGRTLSEILSLSHPDDLDSYTIDSATPSAWQKVVVCCSSSRDGQSGVEVTRFRPRLLYKMLTPYH